MTNTNDEKILKLKEQIEEKKKKLSGIKRFSPTTNCQIEVDGKIQNIQSMNKDKLTALLVGLNSQRLSMIDLNLDDFVISGYKLSEWISDCKSRLEVLSVKEEEASLKKMEEKLHQLLSQDKRVELEISDIEKMLK